MFEQFDLFRAPQEIIPATGKSPCFGCPLQNSGKRVPPSIPRGKPKLVVVGGFPAYKDSDQVLQDAVGQSVRKILAKYGLNPDTEVAYLNVVRCHPPFGDVYSTLFEKATDRCSSYAKWHMSADLKNIPLLLMGDIAVATFLGKKNSALRARGVWQYTANGHNLAFSVMDPYLCATDSSKFLAKQFRADVERCLDRILGRVPPDPTRVVIYDTLDKATPFLRKLAKRKSPWGFDTETYDAKSPVARKGVATNPVHPDQRVLGCGFGLSEELAVYINLRPWETKRLDTSSQPMVAFIEAFLSEADKFAFNGGFDEETLIYDPNKASGFRWIPEIRNRTGDGMLAVIALGDNPQESHTLTKAVVDVLGRHQYWDGVDKSRLSLLPTPVVATGCGKDSIEVLLLCLEMEKRMKREEYL